MFLKKAVPLHQILEAMDASTLIGLGLAAWGLLSNRKQKELSADLKDAKEELAKNDIVLEDTQKELQKFYDKQRDEAGDNYFNDLEIIPVLHIDSMGGYYMSALQLHITNKSKSISYRLGNFYATLEVAGTSANSVYVKKKDAVEILPNERRWVTLWARRGGHLSDYNDSFDRNVLWKMSPLSLDSRLFLNREREFVDGLDHVIRRTLSEVIDTENVLVAFCRNIINLPELSFQVKALSQDWIDAELHNVKGAAYIYFLKTGSLNNFDSIKKGDIYYMPLGKITDAGKDKSDPKFIEFRSSGMGCEMIYPDTVLWNKEEKNKDVRLGPLGWFYFYEDQKDGVSYDHLDALEDTGENAIQEKDA